MPHTLRHGATAALLAPLLLTACGARSTHAAPPNRPVLTRLVPDTLRITPGAVHTLMIEGRGFHHTANTVTLGPFTFDALAAGCDGRCLEVTVPDRVPSGGGAAPMLWTAGRVAVTVRTPAGMSDTLWLEIIP